jgi:hypothetical protein
MGRLSSGDLKEREDYSLNYHPEPSALRLSTGTGFLVVS